MADDEQTKGADQPEAAASSKRRRRRRGRRTASRATVAAHGAADESADTAPRPAAHADPSADGHEQERPIRDPGDQSTAEASTRKRRRRRRRRKPAEEGMAVEPRDAELGSSTDPGGAARLARSTGDTEGRSTRRRGRRRTRDVDRARASLDDRPPAPAPEEPEASHAAIPPRRRAPTLEETIAGFPDEESWDIPGDEGAAASPSAAPRGDAEESHHRRWRPAEEADDDDEDALHAGGDGVPPEGRESILDPPTVEAGEDDLFAGLDDETDPPEGKLHRAVAVRVAVRGDKVGDFDAQELEVAVGDDVIVETERGAAVGTVVAPPLRCVVQEELPRLLRHTDDNDLRQIARNEARQREAFTFCVERIREHKLPMKLIRVEYMHSGNKALFYFSADSRVDFRELVRSLARQLRVRVEMRQVGVRDAAGMVGGIGACGQQLCCALFLQRFDPVSIRMAKDQNLVLNPTKVSGQCGRLKCCLGYEQRLYQKARKKMPKNGSRVSTPDGDGVVRELDIPRQLVTVQRDDGTTETYPSTDVASLGGGGSRR